MPFTPELFSARVLERLEEQGRHQLAAVPYFDGLLAGESDALVSSSATSDNRLSAARATRAAGIAANAKGPPGAAAGTFLGQSPSSRSSHRAGGRDRPDDRRRASPRGPLSRPSHARVRSRWPAIPR